jgi:putative hemolysin
VKWRRVILLAAVVALAACSSPTGPRLPNPNGDDRQPPPPNRGVAAWNR